MAGIRHWPARRRSSCSATPQAHGDSRPPNCPWQAGWQHGAWGMRHRACGSNIHCQDSRPTTAPRQYRTDKGAFITGDDTPSSYLSIVRYWRAARPGLAWPVCQATLKGTLHICHSRDPHATASRCHRAWTLWRQSGAMAPVTSSKCERQNRELFSHRTATCPGFWPESLSKLVATLLGQPQPSSTRHFPPMQLQLETASAMQARQLRHARYFSMQPQRSPLTLPSTAAVSRQRDLRPSP